MLLQAAPPKCLANKSDQSALQADLVNQNAFQQRSTKVLFKQIWSTKVPSKQLWPTERLEAALVNKSALQAALVNQSALEEDLVNQSALGADLVNQSALQASGPQKEFCLVNPNVASRSSQRKCLSALQAALVNPKCYASSWSTKVLCKQLWSKCFGRRSGQPKCFGCRPGQLKCLASIWYTKVLWSGQPKRLGSRSGQPKWLCKQVWFSALQTDLVNQSALVN